MHNPVKKSIAFFICLISISYGYSQQNIIKNWEANGNPVVTHKYTCDPSALVYNDTLFIFTGEDAKGGQKGYDIKNWCVFATTDMKNFVEYNIPLYAKDFEWNKGEFAYAGHVIERNGKFYWYVSTNTTGIGVAVADRPEGPYKDVLGKPLLTNENSPGKNIAGAQSIQPLLWTTMVRHGCFGVMVHVGRFN